MSRACREVEELIDRRERGLADAERLVLEQHLASCASCRQLSRTMRGVVEMLRAAPTGLPESARERAIAGAFARAGTLSPPQSRPRYGLRTGVAAAAAAILLFGAHSVWQQQSAVAPVAQAPRTQPAASSASAAVAEPESEAWIEATAPEERQFAHARVQLERGTRLRFHRASRTLELEGGRAHVDVDPSRGQSFAVLTAHFRVEVLGTQFVVSPEQVEVRHGRVQVLDREGRVLARELASGATFSLQRSAPRAEAPATVERVDAAAPSAETLLLRAREALARSDVEAAYALLKRVERSRPARPARAEAATLRAECALLERNERKAIRGYLGVAKQFGDLPAGENAAFAAAQLSARHGSASAARRLLERYLARYPHGRFVDEARARLAR